MTNCHDFYIFYIYNIVYTNKGDIMLTMATVLVACGILIIIAYEMRSLLIKIEWDENSKSFF